MTLTSCVRQVLLLAHLWAVIQGCSLNRSLEFEKRTTGLVKGCYCHNDSLSLCFEIRQDLIQLTDKKSNILVRYGKLAPQRFHVQVLGDNFLWPHPAAEPLFISTADGKKANSWTEDLILYDAGLGDVNGYSSPALYQGAMKKLRSKQEMKLLSHVALALHNQAKQYPITKAFQVMSLTLLADHRPSHTPARDIETANYDNHRYLKLFGKKRGSCVDLRTDPNRNNCLGMCGPKCWCWKVVCDDCCFHQGCFEHDKCCRKSKFSSYCLLPFFHRFGCRSFGGYPACL